MLTDEQAEAIVRSANKWTTATAVTLSEKNACRAGAAWQREEDARLMRMRAVHLAGKGLHAEAHELTEQATAIRRAGTP
jgi:hypothetical protein